MTPAPLLVLLVVESIHRFDWNLARWAARQAVLARVNEVLDADAD